MSRPAVRSVAPDPVLAAAAGLFARPANLPAWLFYDAAGSELFEQITELPEYYLTRAERSILVARADAIVSRVRAGLEGDLHVVELGAGSATKSQILLEAVVRQQGRCLYVPIDVSGSALDGAADRLRREAPAVDVRPVRATHLQALDTLRAVGARRLVLFLGSSIGNFEPGEATELLGAVARALRPGARLLLGADRRKDPARLLPAYDDAQGVTAAFDLNVLARLNRELGADFDLARWRHEARWNARASRVEMHLVAQGAQLVRVPGLGARPFAAGESIHTESSHKYDAASIARLAAPAGFVLEETYADAEGLFDLHLLRLEG